MGIWYTTREDVMSAQDIKATAYSGRDIDRAIESGARSTESLLHRVLYPWTGTRYFDFPNRPGTPSWRIWFGRFDLISATSITNNDGSTISTANVYLNPQDGPPYEYVEINRGTTSAYATGTTNQRAVSITGLWGHSNSEEIAGTIAEDLDLTETGVDGSGMPTVGVGSIIRVDSERMVVTEKAWLTTAQTATLTANNNAQSITVADGTAFVAGETLLIESERLHIGDIAGNVLTVRRAVDGSTLAAHASATVYAQRSLTVQRGALGTAAATHTSGATCYRWLPPGPAAELNLAYAIDAILQRESGYARTVGEADNQAEMTGRAIAQVEKRARAALGRQARTAAI